MRISIRVYAYWAEVNYAYILVRIYLSCTVGAVKVATVEGSNLLSSKEVTMAFKPQPTLMHLSTQH